MSTSRLEAFSDGVLAIIITIMVLELHTPRGDTLADLWHTTGSGLLTYALSFAYVGIYWTNHHHLFQLADEVDGAVLWANLHLLLWLSLLPLTTAWMDESSFAATPTAVYGVDLLFAAVAYFVLQLSVMRQPVSGPRLRAALGRDLKGKISPVLYLLGIAVSLLTGGVAMILYVAAAVLWLVPDRRIDRFLAAERAS